MQPERKNSTYPKNENWKIENHDFQNKILRP